MIQKIGITSSEITTYDKNDFYNNWKEINKNLAERWDSVIEHNPHHEISTTLTDKYWTEAITKLLKNLSKLFSSP